MGRNIPEGLKRNARKRAHFGCVICGNPIIEYHHIEAYSIVKKHEDENIVALCSEHHHRVGCGEITNEILNRYIKEPFNLTEEMIKKDFFLSNYKDLIFKVGGNSFLRTPNLLVVNKMPLIQVGEDLFGNAVLNIKFYNQNNVLQAEVKNNEWIVHKTSEVWDIKYSPGKLKINKNSKKVLLELEMRDGKIELTAEMYYQGHLISIKANEISNSMITMSECTLSDCDTGINLNY